jgi:hypothetical protein
MKRLVTWSITLLTVGALVCSGEKQAAAVTMGFVNNPTSNSTNWINTVTGLNGVINTAIDFNTYPLGALQSNFYLGSAGVTLTPSGDVNTVQFGSFRAGERQYLLLPAILRGRATSHIELPV